MRSLASLLNAGLLGLLLPQLAVAAPADDFMAALNSRADRAPLLHRDFPDPSIIQDTAGDGTWYAVATASGNKQVQVASAPKPEGPWTYLDRDLLPDPGPWTTGKNTWAPDLRVLGKNKYVLYYSGKTKRHCVGAATATSILGPYTPQAQPIACPEDKGGAIDPSGINDDRNGRRYITYKVDGSAIGTGGECGNGDEPIVPTPLMLQEVSTADGFTKIGAPVQLLDRIAEDGPLIEAPQIVRVADGTYILFYSSHCFNSANYDVKYATAADIRGPYKRAGTLLKTGSLGMSSPGGGTSIVGGGYMVLHANCDAGGSGRCMYGVKWTWSNGKITVS
ncbi:uncharacterized protein E0L32_009152 [Thyridium curvatum]|uniref:Uncharacterized protein n=1 Tax=Thyridium curvatum TaxID=1093900 RepID=A0A507AXG7_9PEZI|nr:uncharacterized protein E0L32_009152 [Thyridium curvatum]TPX09679.1 hypothetical protein E0L32_009152 [Thyridium curvatum]